MQKNVFASRTANLACRPSYSTVLLIYYFSILLQIQYCRGQCLGLTTRDAKKFSTYYHVLQQNVVFASRTANLACRPSYSTVLLFYYLLFHSRYSTAAADVWGWPPEMQKVFHVLPRTTTYCHVLQQNVGLHLGQPTLHVGPPILFFTNLIFYYFTPDTVLPRPMFGVGRPRCKKVFHVLPRTTTYYHVLQRTTTYYSRT